jgi:hypothetical protein
MPSGTRAVRSYDELSELLRDIAQNNWQQMSLDFSWAAEALGVGELFKISILEFLEQPRELVELMFEIAEDKTIREDRHKAQVARDLERTMGG